MFDLAVWLPGLVFVGLAVWLVRKIWRAARTEGDLEDERLEGALADELRAARQRAAGLAPPPPPLAVVKSEKEKENENEIANEVEHEHENVFGVPPAHLEIIRALIAEREAQIRATHKGPADVARRVELLWARSNATHAVWCERRHAATLAARAVTRDVICVAQIEKGKVLERWYFG